MDMNYNIKKLRHNVQKLMNLLDDNPAIKLNATAVTSFLRTFLNKPDNNREDVSAVFNYLKTIMFNDMFTKPIAIAFEDCLIYLLSLVIDDNEVINEDNFINYQWRCIGLAKLIHLSPTVKRRATQYFLNKRAPFAVFYDNSNIPSNSKCIPSNFDIIKCCYHLLQADRQFFKDLWDWSIFLTNYAPLNNSMGTFNTECIYINHILSMLSNMNAVQLQELNAGIPPEALVKFDHEQVDLITKPSLPDLSTQTKAQNILLPFKSEMVTSIEGIFLTIFDKDNARHFEKFSDISERLVMVGSTKTNIRNVALGIYSGKAICLSGPVGCGKTTIITYLARKTGRICAPFNFSVMESLSPPTEDGNDKKNCKGQSQSQKQCTSKARPANKRKSNESDEQKETTENLITGVKGKNGFLRIQLGDQTDSKMLLGQYTCTDMPGEFIWLPGILTEAVMNGYWLLLEDLDCTTPDVYAILSNLLENNYLSVPGYRDCIKIAPEFQLFVTLRTHKSSSSMSLPSSQRFLFNVLDKYLYTVNLMPLSRSELCKIVSTNYPKLMTVANRIVDIFLTFSSGEHTDATDQNHNAEGEELNDSFMQMPCERISIANITSSSRLVSTRDLIKFCRRSCPSFSATDAECAYFVFQNAVDIFCSYLPDTPDKTTLIVNVGAKLGITPSRCQHYAEVVKPEISIVGNSIKIGRITLYGQCTLENNPECRLRVRQKRPKLMSTNNPNHRIFNRHLEHKPQIFSFTRITSCLMERLAVCIHQSEPVLLVGETGVGKTAIVQYLAEKTRNKLLVVNMNNQSDVADLMGGFKPIDLSHIMLPIRVDFEVLFRQIFNEEKNANFLHKFWMHFKQGNYLVLVKLMLKIIELIEQKHEANELHQFADLMPRWRVLAIKLNKLHKQMNKSLNMSFAFIPGVLVNCVKHGGWILLDEINLASTETLECLSTVLEQDGSVVLLEEGDFQPVERNPNFRIFACMNPSTDIGKKDLPIGIRNRFTEFFVDEVISEVDLYQLVMEYLSGTGVQRKTVVNLVKLFKKLKQMTDLKLSDGMGNRPVYSMRTLCRSLRACAKNLCGSLERNIYESFCMSFLSQLDTVSYETVLNLITSSLLSNSKAVLNYNLPKPGDDFINIEGYWIPKGSQPVQKPIEYILTPSVKQNLRNIARIISIGKLPILLQGPTSAGKTSLINYIAQRTGNTCLRINNHEHTDLQEYVGVYTTDETGKLIFQEGILVQAMRFGYWMILDELNLASTEILEALNRVLDDNREIFITESQTLLKAHENFMLFATQNPPGIYGGRKTLSRAFKNRFVELHFCNIPRSELEIILKERCLIPASCASRMVSCISDLQMNRKTSTKSLFTLRDLFRWGNRYSLANTSSLDDNTYDWNRHLVEEGFLVLSAKVRTALEIAMIKEALQKHFKKTVDEAELFDIKHSVRSGVTKEILTAIEKFQGRKDIAWTVNMTRMAVLTAKALQFNEPVLLVGPTSSGKTTVCQILAAIQGVQLRILNCHMHTEAADFLGGLRPCRQSNDSTNESKGTATVEQQQKVNKVSKLFEWTNGPLVHAMQEGSYFLADEISLAEDSVLERLNCVLEPGRSVFLSEKGGIIFKVDQDDFTKDFIIRAKDGFQFLATMNPGGDFGKRELSPALRNRFTEIWCEPSNQKDDLIKITTKCLNSYSMDLVNDDILEGLYQNLAIYLVDVALYICEVVEKFKFSIRDILAWANYVMINKNLSFPQKIIYGLETIFLDSLEMLSLHLNKPIEIESSKDRILQYAMSKAKEVFQTDIRYDELEKQRSEGKVSLCKMPDGGGYTFEIAPFSIPVNVKCIQVDKKRFFFDAPTTKKNLFRLLSALTLNQAILLEGPPGVGKTSIVENLARVIGFKIVRINLCEQTDLADLFGTDLPAEDDVFQMSRENVENPNVDNEDIEDGQECLSENVLGSFAWRDGPLLAALKSENTWILLDELNLAPQSVLEGLNPILDHRNEVYISELNKTFTLHKKTRIFACQNPLRQGGGRKGLPQSFLNRFTKVYFSELKREDLLYIVHLKFRTQFLRILKEFCSLLPLDLRRSGGDLFDIYKVLLARKKEESDSSNTANNQIRFSLVKKMVQFSEILANAVKMNTISAMVEINLRDILRWCELLLHSKTGYNLQKGKTFVENFDALLLILYERMKLIYHQRLRSEGDRKFVRQTFAEIFQIDLEDIEARSRDIALYWTAEKIYLNDIVIERSSSSNNMLYESNNPCTYLTQPLTNIDKNCSTLLLGTQRETLKNLIESVHIDKPVILSGSNDSGKTKIIDALNKVSNQICNTDTIDDSVTGGFQQVDVNRHLEDIAQHIESVYLKCMQRISIDFHRNKAIVLDILHCWSIYIEFSHKKFDFYSSLKNNAVSPELDLFRKRLCRLQNVITILLKYKNNLTSNECNILRIQEQQLHLLLRHMRNASTLNTVGLFEWVDSKIVKSLKLGHHIVLEHVNLCSSAVLDRLNPVFEPEGRLVLSEKGITKQNTIESITKAPNFHAFLTMDPKNGELSRAMRNRCIEIALLEPIRKFENDHETNDTNNNNATEYGLDLDDKRLLIYSLGIQEVLTINCMIDIFKDVVNLTAINNFNLQHLLRAAFLTASYLSIGYSTSSALFISHIDVYVAPAVIDYMGAGLQHYQQKLREIIMMKISRLSKNTTTESNHNYNYLNDMLLRCDRLMLIDLIKWQMIPLRIAVEQGAENTAKTFAIHFSSLKQMVTDDYDYEKLVTCLIFIFYGCSSFNDLLLRHHSLKNVLEPFQHFLKLSIYAHGTVQKFRNDKNFSTLPPDLPWNMKLYPRLRDYANDTLDIHSIQKRANVLNAVLITELFLTKQTLPISTNQSLKTINIFNYSCAIYKKEIQDRFQNSFLQNFSECLFCIQCLFKIYLNNLKLDAEDQIVQLVTRLSWWKRVIDMSKSNPLLVNNTLNINILNKLLVMFHWLDKYLFNFIMKFVPNEFRTSEAFANPCWEIRQSSDPLKKLYANNFIYFPASVTEEEIMLSNFEEHLAEVLISSRNSTAYKRTDILKKYLMQKSLKLHEIQFELIPYYCRYKDYSIQELNLPISAVTNNSDTLDTPDTNIITSSSPISQSIQSHLSYLIQKYNRSVKCHAISLNCGNISTTFDEFVKANLKNLKDSGKDVGGVVQNAEDFSNELEILMMPLQEYFFSKACIRKFNYNPSHNHHNSDTYTNTEDLNEFNMDYCQQLSNFPTATWLLFTSLTKEHYKDFRRIWCILMEHLQPNGSAGSDDEVRNIYMYEESFDDLIQFLNGNYRHLNKCHRLLLNDIQELQLDNLSIRSRYLARLFHHGESISEPLSNYEGSQLLNAISGLLYPENGQMRNVSIHQLKLWQNTLEQMQELLWFNSLLMSSQYNSSLNNERIYRANAKRLLHEIYYLKCHLLPSFKEKKKNRIEGMDSSSDQSSSKDAVLPDDFIGLVQRLISSLQKVDLEELQEQRPDNVTLDPQLLLLYNNSMIGGMLGCVEMCLFIFTPLVDPIEKKQLKKSFMLDDIETLRTLRLSYDIMRSNLKSKYFAEDFYNSLTTELHFLEEKLKKYEEKLPLRPTDSNYDKLKKSIQHFIRNNCSPTYLNDFFAELSMLSRKLLFHKSPILHPCSSGDKAQTLTDTIEYTLKKINLWIGNCHHFMTVTLREFRTYYQDFIRPLQCALNQLRLGFVGFYTLLIQFQQIHKQQLNALTNSENSYKELKQTLQDLIQFPNLYKRNTTVTTCHKTDSLGTSSVLYTLLKQLPDGQQNYLQLIKAKLMELNNRILNDQHINSYVFQELEAIYRIVQEVWQREEEERQRKQQEADSLYVHQTKCKESSETVLEQQEIAEIFPTNLQNDYGDILGEELSYKSIINLNDDLLVDDTLTLTHTPNTMKNTEKTIEKLFDREDYLFMVKSFMKLFQNYTLKGWEDSKTKRTPPQQQMDFFSNYKIRLEVFMKLYADHHLLLNDALDEEVFNSLHLAVQIFAQEANSNSNRSTYNFYKDPNVSAVSDALQILDELEKRVLEFLDQFPEHAVLIDIQKILWRIRHLPFKAPLIRFNTGFQILRQKIAQWNEIAHKQIKLDEEEVAVAQLVQKWTTMELQCWRNCLKEVQQRVETQAYRYWFFIYALVHEYLTGDKTLGENRREFGEQVTNGKLDIRNILLILRQFLEAATFGDFHVRLTLMKSFESYLLYQTLHSKDKSRKGKILDLITGIFNLQVYFEQFANEVNERKAGIRSPIEKKLKEFVKIESYNKDLSYFSMRNNVARVHRQLNKFLKTYQKELEEKITIVFQIQEEEHQSHQTPLKPGDKSPIITTNEFNENQLRPKDTFIGSNQQQEGLCPEIVCDIPVPSTYSSKSSSKLIEKLANHHKNARMVVESLLQLDSYNLLIQNLNDVFVEYMDYSRHLTSLLVDRSQERPKQIKQAKQIVQQKRKGLNDFFKTLTSIGINYKTGLMELSLDSDTDTHLTTIKPFNVEYLLNLPAFKRKYAIKGKEFQQYYRNIKQLTKNLNNYFAKCCYKLKSLQNRMLTPLSELGLPIIERIKGYAMDMFRLIQQQRQLLSQTANELQEVHHVLQDVYEIRQVLLETKSNTNFDSDPIKHLQFAESDRLKVHLTQTFSQILYVIEQFKLLLNCAPQKDNLKNCLFNNSVYSLRRSSDNFIKLNSLSSEVCSLSQKSLNDLISKSNQGFISPNLIQGYVLQYQKVLKILHQLLDLLKTRKTIDMDDQYLPLARPLLQLLEEIPENLHNHPKAGVTRDDFRNFPIDMETTIYDILLSMQKLYKKYNTSGVTISEMLAVKDSEIPDFYLKKTLYEGLLADWQNLNIENISQKLTKLLLVMKNAPASEEKLFYVEKFVHILPLLEQFILIGDYYQYRQLSTHKICLRMLSAMLTIFIEISTKGFCIPADLMQDEEMKAEFLQQQNQSEKFGLEEDGGGGGRDASDKIESEDQLDDAKRPEDRKNDEKKDQQQEQQPDCKEEKGIEMSEDFDGKIQDLAENDDDGNQEQDPDDGEEEEFDKEMAETEEGADKLDEQIWGDDEEDNNDNKNEPQNSEQEGKGNNEETNTHNDLSAQNEMNDEIGEDKQNPSDALDATSKENDNRQPGKKDISEMADGEIDEDQENPYHNELEEPPEPENMDLDNMNQNSGDEREANDDIDMMEQQENPFDIDKMKENMQKSNNEMKENEEEEGKDVNEDNIDADPDDDSSDDNGSIDNSRDHDQHDADNKQSEELNNPENRTEEEDIPMEPSPTNDNKENENDNENENEENTVEEYRPSRDKSTKQDNVETVETDSQNDPNSFDNAPPNKANEKDIKQDNKMDEQDVGEEKNAIGQAENYDKETTGHQGIAESKEKSAAEQSKNTKESAEKRKQGNTNEKRCLGDEADKSQVKRLKTIDKMTMADDHDKDADKKKDDCNEDQEMWKAEEYQHIMEAKQTDKYTLDNATEEQAKQIQHQNDAEAINKDEDNPNDMMDDDDQQMLIDDKIEEETSEQKDNDLTTEELQSKDFVQNSNEPNKTSGNNSDKHLETAKTTADIEGDTVPTTSVQRSNETTAHCNHNLLSNEANYSLETENNDPNDSLKLKQMYLDQMQQPSTLNAISGNGDVDLWLQISNRMESKAREFCEQLRLILEPTKCSRFKGDYRTGRRINMKKIIPYIASQFRKDKIWLRRTKPAQRDYKITIAIDDSKSMDHNRSKVLTLEAISLVAQALTLLESGELSVLSFGEKTKIILNGIESFDGSKLVTNLNFSQNKTKIAELLDFVRTMINEQASSSATNALFANLLLILSDGRNIFAEGKVRVNNAVKLARLQRIFMVYIIIDNPENNSSILDIQTMEMSTNRTVTVRSYLDEFPFPYYVIVRDLEQLPIVLSEAMRQWFELVNSE